MKVLLASFLCIIFIPVGWGQPYPQSEFLTDINLDWSSHRRGAVGSDNFQLTWSDDGHQYGVWGDGGGFTGTRVSMGVARISGDGDNWTGSDIWYGDKDNALNVPFSGKSWGMFSEKGDLYTWFVPDVPSGKSERDHYAYVELLRSTDHAASWKKAPWQFLNSESLSIPTFLNFDKDNKVSRDDYIYSYFLDPQGHKQPQFSLNVHKPGNIYLSRISRNKLSTSKKTDFEWYKGPPGGGASAAWGILSEKQPVYVDPEGVGWCMSACYIRGLDRYLLVTEHGTTSSGMLGIFEAPNPWGPWKTVKYWTKAEYFGKTRPGSNLAWKNNVFFVSFSSKWQSKDGKGFTLNYTGLGGGQDNDSFNTVNGSFEIGTPVVD